MNEIKKNTSVNPALFILAGLLYVLSPIDIVPDFIPILGWLDDIGVIGFLIQLYRMYKQKREAELLKPTIVDAPLKALK
jgi:uncharacterized membrane protein YkvA (DUF1232 family)